MKKWLLLVCLLPAVCAAAEKPWTWKDSTGAVRSQADLDQILADNTKWVDTGGKQGDQGVLSHADLRGAALANRDLRGVDLTGANLDGADLTAANLNSPDQGETDLTEATLRKANLNGAHLKGAYLGGGDLHHSGANLRGARLTVADLTGADLTNATLIGADLEDAVLTGAQMEGADLKGALFQPSDGPSPSQIGTALHLADLRYNDDPQPIVSLRNSLLDAGFEQAGREVNRAYHRHRENLLQWLLFDWTCAWGADPQRPLVIVGALCALCTLIYWIAMHFQMERAGLDLVTTGTSAADDGAKEHVARILVVPPRSQAMKAGTALDAQVAGAWHRLIRRPGLELRALMKAFVFSLMSVFTIGVEGFNGSEWMRMLMPREFDIRPRGWVRTVSGMQALLGAGLIALSLLSYFGHPFW